MFLTNPDPRAEVRGSRDPLGLVPLWSRFGRHVVGNLTTVTTSVRGFTTTLLGYYFAREVQEEAGPKSESVLDLFLKFEQIGGYCRHAFQKDGGDIRGIERVRKRLGEGGPLRISAAPEDQILSNQKVYGLWGLYSGPSRASGLLRPAETVLTAEAQQFVEGHYLKALSAAGFREGAEIVALLRQPRAEFQIDGKHAKLAKAIGGLHGRAYPRNEREFYWRHLVLGGPQDSTKGLQEKLVSLMEKLPSDERFSRHDLRALTKEAKRRALDELAGRLEQIDQVESVLAPAGLAFGFLLGRNGQLLSSIGKEVAKAWGKRLAFVDVEAIEALKGEISSAFHDPAAGPRWVQIAAALSAGNYEGLLRLLLEHNKAVMQSRSGSAPWARLSSGKLDVRYRDEAGNLPSREELPNLWVNNYFLNSLKVVRATLAA